MSHGRNTTIGETNMKRAILAWLIILIIPTGYCIGFIEFGNSLMVSGVWVVPALITSTWLLVLSYNHFKNKHWIKD